MSYNILFVVDEMTRGGGPGVCYQLVKRLIGSEFRACLVTLFSKGVLAEELETCEVPVLSLDLRQPFRPKHMYQGVADIVAFGRTQEVHLVHAHLSASGLYGGLASKILRVPAVFTVHGHLSTRFSLRIAEMGIRHLFRTVGGVSRLIDSEVRRYSVLRRRRRFAQVYNGIDTSFWAPQETLCNVSLPKDGKRIRIAMVANFSDEKDHQTILDAFGLFKQKYRSSCLILAGEGSNRAAMEGYVRRTGVGGVGFPGTVGDVRGLLTTTDIFVLASFTEGISISVLEAMAMGVPVVASDVGGMSEIIRDTTHGVLVRPQSPEALFQALDGLVNRPEGLRTMRIEARKRVVDSFSVEVTVCRYKALYRQILGM